MAFECTYSLKAGSAPVFHEDETNKKKWTAYEVRSPYTGLQWRKPGRWSFNVDLDATATSMKGTMKLADDAADPDDAEIKKAFAESQTIVIRLKFGNGRPGDLTAYLKP